jgi:hypothetical protein
MRAGPAHIGIFSNNKSFPFGMKTFVHSLLLRALSFDPHQINEMLRVGFSLKPELVVFHRRFWKYIIKKLPNGLNTYKCGQ